VRRTPTKVLITGASSGIGRALALEYGRRGAHVMVAARRQAELDSLCDELRAAGGKGSALVLDVADPEAAFAAAGKAASELGGLHMVIANAGVGESKHATRTTLDQVVRMMDINVRGAMATLLGGVSIMAEQKGGQLVGVSSLAGRRALPAGAPYSASKAALSCYLEGLRLDLSRMGIGVTDVQPGFVDTPMTKKNNFEMPFMWDAPKAASYICDRLERDPRIVAFPFPLTLLTRLGQRLPYWLYARIVGGAASRRA
jgi:NAD(P)-dependent dehydrogenase (short-subunit alcohol dehydrogenase family)